MKKKFAAFLAVLLAMNLIACGSTPTGESTPSITTKATETITPETTVEPTTITTTAQEPTVYPLNAEEYFDTDYITAPPSIVYTTPASENGLDGTIYAVTGTVLEYHPDDEGFGYFLIETTSGVVAVGTYHEYVIAEFAASYEEAQLDEDLLRSYFAMPSVGDVVCIYAEYTGFSDSEQCAFFVYGGNDYLSDALTAICNEGELPSTSEPAGQELGTTENPYPAGMYKVGTDLPAGEYMFLATGSASAYFCASEDANQDRIIENENFDSYFFATVSEGQYVEASRCVFVKAADYFITTDPANLSAGMYRVGTDIPAGEYKLTATSNFGGYYCIYGSSDIPFKIVNNDNFENTAYVTLLSGQYVILNRCTAELVD